MRAVSLLDVLGFRKRVQTTPLPELAQSYETAIRNAHALNNPPDIAPNHPQLFSSRDRSDRWCLQHIFSDTIVLVSLSDDEASCLKLIVHTWRLSQALLGFQMPVRGAMTFGELHVNKPLNIFVGKALTDAYELEQAQEWIGVAIDDSLVSACPSIFSVASREGNILAAMLPRYPVPLKGGEPREMVTVNWRWNLIVERGTRSLLPAAEDDASRRKIENTESYLQAVVAAGLTYAAQPGAIPAELQTFWVGEREPPFAHGDDL